MLITAIITLALVIAWAVTARTLFRRWVRNDTFAKRDQYLDRSGIHDRVTPRSHKVVAGYAISTALILPVLAIGDALLLPGRVFAAFVTHNPPLNPRELAERTASLEEENRQLREAAEQRDQDPHEARTIAARAWEELTDMDEDEPLDTD